MGTIDTKERKPMMNKNTKVLNKGRIITVVGWAILEPMAKGQSHWY